MFRLHESVPDVPALRISTLENILIHETKQAIIQSLYKFEVV